MPDTTARIRAKGLDTTGVTEDLAAEMFKHVGRHYMAIVDLHVVDKHGPDVKGKRGVELIIDNLEPATDDTLAEHLRELTRTLYFNRGQRDGQLAIDDQLGDERTVEDVMAAGAQHRPHPSCPSTPPTDNPICDVCGLLETAPIHSAQDTLPAPGEDAHDPHTYDEAEDLEECVICGHNLDHPIHVDEDQVDDEPSPDPDPDPDEQDTIPNPFTTT